VASLTPSRMGTMTFCSTRAIDLRDSKGSSWEEGKVAKKISSPIVKRIGFWGDFICDSSLRIGLFQLLRRKYYKKTSRPVNKGNCPHFI
jgi:hypothetical protein